MGGEWTADFRHVVRKLWASPGFTLVAVASLAIGIGANAALFGAIRALLLDPMPVESPEQLHLVAWRRDARIELSNLNSTAYPDPGGGEDYRSNLSHPVYEAMKAGAPDGAELFAFTFLRGVSVAAGDAPALMTGGLLADGAYFATLGVRMAQGRPLTQADDEPGAPLTAVLSHRFWMRAFGGDPATVGRTIRVNGLATEVVGVTAEGFRGVSKGGFFPQTDITLPLTAQPEVSPRWRSESGGPLLGSQNTYWLRVMARVRPDVSSDRVASVLSAAFQGQPTVANEGEGPPAEVALLPGAQGAQPVGASSARALFILMGAGGLVLLIACVNLAGLMLARGVSQLREMAIRRALGCSRWSLVWSSFQESLVLAGMGTAAGLVLAFATRKGLGRLVADGAGGEAFGRIAAESALNAGVALFAILLAVGSTLLFGTLPALRLSGVDPMGWLRQQAGGLPRLTASRVLLSLQIGVSVPLLVGSVLLMRTMSNLDALELGFDPEGMYTFQLDPTYARVPREAYAHLYLQVLEEVQSIPGVSSASLVENPPLGSIASNTRVEIDGVRHNLHLNAIGPDFIRASGMRLIEGRMPGIQDTREAPRVAVVNERVVRDVFGGTSPVGRTLTLGPVDYEVIGVLNDSRYRDRRSDMPATVFPSALQRTGFGGNHVVVRTALPQAQLEFLLREAVGRVNRDLPVSDLTSQVARVTESTARERLMTRLITAFSVFALLLASIGLHGVVAYSVGRRTREIGIRVAVGARPGAVRWLALRQVLVLSSAGLLVGVPLALGAGSLLNSLLYGVAPADGFAIAGASALLVAVALAAGYGPARRASRMDPIEALRTE